VNQVNPRRIIRVALVKKQPPGNNVLAFRCDYPAGVVNYQLEKHGSRNGPNERLLDALNRGQRDFVWKVDFDHNSIFALAIQLL
jgi:hypothetical protein